MIRTGQEYLDSIRDAREVYINGERVKALAEHPMFKPLIDIRARIYDMQHESGTREVLSFREEGQEEWHAIANKLPRTQEDWWAKRRATDTILETIGGIVTRVGDETVGEMWSLFDGQMCSTRSTRNSRPTSDAISTPSCIPIRFMSRRIPIPRVTARSRPRSRIPTCSCTSSARRTRASSFAGRNTRPRRLTRTRHSPSRRTRTGAARRCPTMPSGLSAISTRRA